jgi:exonuclease SbcD
VFAVLSDRAPLLDALARVREVYPNCVELDRSAFLEQAVVEQSDRHDLRRLDERQLFGAFVERVTGEPISDAEAVVFGDIVDALARREREVES